MKKYRVKDKNYVVFNIKEKVIKCYSKKWKEHLLNQGYKMSLYYR